MELESVQTIPFHASRITRFNLAIAATGYESRAIYAAEQYGLPSMSKRVAFGFNDRKILHRSENDRRFRDLGFRLQSADGDDESVVEQVIESLIDESTEETMRIWCDYTSMTRVW